MLTHQYCEASLYFQTLRNVNRAAVDVLVNAKKQENFHLYLGQVTLSQQWSCYSTSFDYYRSSYQGKSHCISHAFSQWGGHPEASRQQGGCCAGRLL